MKKTATLISFLVVILSVTAVQASFKCHGKNLRINRHTMYDVIQKCGEPVFKYEAGSVEKGKIKEESSADEANEKELEKASKVIEIWVYHCRARKWALTFKGGVLIKIQQGERIKPGDRNSFCGN